jgi:hypothetical protein
MKNLKLSKTSWLILSAGVFIVILAGLGLTRSQQLQDLSTSTQELQIAAKRLSTMDTTDLKAQVDSLQEQITLGQADLADATSRLNKSVVSADVAEEFYSIAEASGVVVNSFTSTPVSAQSLQGIPVSETAVSGQVKGTLKQVIDFITNVNTSFRTGYVKSASLQLDTPPEPGMDADADTNASIQLIIYSYTK